MASSQGTSLQMAMDQEQKQVLTVASSYRKLVLVMGMVSWEPGSSPRPTHSQGSLGPKVLGMVSQTQGTKCSGAGETTAQGLGGNDQSLLQGMGQKLWCTPKQELQPLKEMCRPGCCGTLAGPPFRSGGLA
ncbi:PREDICTED: uncharacterized protein LOC105517628 [Colobus angolensis palliatus]|uniref:uncharacterized protein LOC105517628 n=1 Tax=Colobus angolensis palliatus TaxID=336983 RepID=UPI0005F3A263|nr:PREDICTED: uncharacterized protein LOC105517628 [Colobus angolensis palliatus]